MEVSREDLTVNIYDGSRNSELETKIEALDYNLKLNFEYKNEWLEQGDNYGKQNTAELTVSVNGSLEQRIKHLEGSDKISNEILDELKQFKDLLEE